MDSLELDKSKIPVHVGIIMDGNGRWAKKRLMPRNFGHKEILTYLAKIVSSKTIEYNKKTKNVKYYGNEVYLDYLTNENNEFTDIEVKI